MKKVFLLFCLLLAVATAPACDICGCGVGSYYFGVMPQFNKNFVGLRYRSVGFESHLNSRILRTQEYFHTMELWTRFYASPKLQVMAFVPYSFNSQSDVNQATKRLQGLNDVAVMANYNVLNLYLKNDTLVRKFKHNLWLGGGLKLPTGAYNFEEQDAGQVANANFQLGSGSLDFLLTAFYNVRYLNWGFNQDISYKINTSNSKDYRFGNRISGNSNVFYIQQIQKNLALMPYIGLYYEHSAQDFRNKEQIRETGGYLTAVNVGLDVYIAQRVTVGGNYQIPLSQNLGNGELRAQERLNVQFSVLF